MKNRINRITWLSLAALFASLLLAGLRQTVALAQTPPIIEVDKQHAANPDELITVTITYDTRSLGNNGGPDIYLYYQFEPMTGFTFTVPTEGWRQVNDNNGDSVTNMRYWAINEPTKTVTIALQMTDEIMAGTILTHVAFLITDTANLLTVPIPDDGIAAMPFQTEIVAPTDEAELLQPPTFNFDPPPQVNVVEGDPTSPSVILHIHPADELAGKRLRLTHADSITPTIGDLNELDIQEVFGATTWAFPSEPSEILRRPLRLQLEFSPETTQQEITSMVMQVISAENEPYENAFTFNEVARTLVNAVPPSDADTDEDDGSGNSDDGTINDGDSGAGTDDGTTGDGDDGSGNPDDGTTGDGDDSTGTNGGTDNPDDGTTGDGDNSTGTDDGTTGDGDDGSGNPDDGAAGDSDEGADMGDGESDNPEGEMADGDSESEQARLPAPVLIAIIVAAIGLIGVLLFLFLRSRAEAVPANQPMQTGHAAGGVLGGPATGGIPVAPARPTTSPAMAQPHLRLQSDNRAFQLDPNTTTIGRGEMNGIVIDDTFPGWESVSREHARIVRQDAGYVIEDLGSSNGIFVQNRPTAKNLLKDGWTVGIGGVQFTFHNPRGGV